MSHDPGDEDDYSELRLLMRESLDWAMIRKWALTYLELFPCSRVAFPKVYARLAAWRPGTRPG